MHLIGLPFCRVFVTVGNQAAIIPIHVYGLQKAVKQLTCCHHVLLIFQLQLKIWYSYNVNNVRKTTYLVIKNTVWSCISIIWGRIGAEGQCAAEPLQVMLKIVFTLYSNQIPALMAKGIIPPYTALVQSTLVLAFLSKILLLQPIAVLCTDGRVQWGVEYVAGLVAHWCDLVSLLLFLINL